MKRSLFLKALCCLLALCLLSGCTPKSPLLAHADDDSELGREFAAVYLEKYNYSIENQEKESIYLTPHPEFKDCFLLDGTMLSQEEKEKCGRLWIRDQVFSKRIQVPFSKSFTVCEPVKAAQWEPGESPENESEGDYEFRTESCVCFRKEDGIEVTQLAYGSWDKAVHHCNTVIELYGDLSRFRICFVRREEPHYDTRYTLDGAGKDHVIAALVDGEVLTEGLAENYTVTITGWGIGLIRKEYDQYGNLISTTEE